MPINVQVRRNTSAVWISSNPILESGEIGFETDTNRQKIGDGVTRWVNLTYPLVSSFNILNASTLSISTIRTSIIPAADSVYDLGAPGASFRSLYVAGSTIYLGAAKLSSDADGNFSVVNATGQSTTVNLLQSSFSTLTASTISTDNLQGSATSTIIVNSHLIPASTLTYDLGSPSSLWRSVYIGANTINIGSSKLSADPDGNLVVTNTSGQATASNVAAKIFTESFCVAADSNGILVYSYDGLAWTATTNPIRGDCATAAWNGSYWLCGGTAGAGSAILGVSSDGITWQPVTGSNLSYVAKLAWNGSLWVAVGRPKIKNTVCIDTSPDGVNWTLANNMPFGLSGSGISTFGVDVAWNGKYWVATCKVFFNPGGQVIATSSDGLNWIGRSSPLDGFGCNTIAWNGSLWAAGGTVTPGGGTIATSPDGIVWTSVTGLDSNGLSVISIAWNGRILLASTQVRSLDVGSTVYSSRDGITWVSSVISLIGKQLSHIAWNGSNWIAGSGGKSIEAPQVIYTSTDGVTWTPQTSPLNGQNIGASANFIAPRRLFYINSGGGGTSGPAISTFSTLTTSTFTTNSASVPVLRDVTTINGLPYVTGGTTGGLVSATFTPTLNNTYDLGSVTSTFRRLYVSTINGLPFTGSGGPAVSTFSTLTVSSINGLPFNGSGGPAISTFSTLTVSSINGLPFNGSGGPAVSTFSTLTTSSLTINSASVPVLRDVTTINGQPYVTGGTTGGLVSATFTPTLNNTYDLGSATSTFRRLYISTINDLPPGLSSFKDLRASTLVVSSINGLPFTGSGGPTVSTFSTLTVSSINGLPFTGSGGPTVSTFSTLTTSSLIANSASVLSLRDVASINGLPYVAAGTTGGLVSASLIPALDKSYDLGTATSTFRQLFVSTINGQPFTGGGGPEIIASTLTTGIINSANLDGAIALNASLIPAADNAFDLGAPGSTIRALYINTTNTSQLNTDLIVGLSESPKVRVRASLIPAEDNAFDLGAPGSSFRSLYVAASTIHIGNAAISASPTGGLIFTNTLTNQSTSSASAPPTASGTLAGNMSMTGGGLVTWSSDSIEWNGDVTIVTNLTNASTTQGTVLKVGPSTVAMSSLDMLYYAPPVGTSSLYNGGSLHVINGHDHHHEPVADNWFLLANTSSDNSILKWNPASVSLPANSHYNSVTTRTSVRATEVVWNTSEYDPTDVAQLPKILIGISKGESLMITAAAPASVNLPVTYVPQQGDIFKLWNVGQNEISVKDHSGTTLFTVPSTPSGPAMIYIYDRDRTKFIACFPGSAQQLPGDTGIETPRQPPTFY